MNFPFQQQEINSFILEFNNFLTHFFGEPSSFWNHAEQIIRTWTLVECKACYCIQYLWKWRFDQLFAELLYWDFYELLRKFEFMKLRYYRTIWKV